MKIDDIRKIAEHFISTQDMKNYTVKFIEMKDLSRWPNQWSVIFDLYSPEGSIVDSPIIVIVDKNTLEARFFEYTM